MGFGSGGSGFGSSPSDQHADVKVTGSLEASSDVTFAQTLTVQGNFTANANTTLGNAATDIVTVTGQLTASNGIKIAELENAGSDTDAFLVSNAGVVQIRTGAQVLSDIGAGGVSDDTIWTGELTASNGFNVSTGSVGIGISTPDALLHLRTGAGPDVAPHAGAKDFVVESNGTVGMSILGGAANSARIYFGSSGGNRDGKIDYNLNDDIMQFGAANETRMSISADGVDLDYATATVSGSGWRPQAANTTFISKVNGEIVTTILLELDNLACSGTIDKAVIGNVAGTAGAYLTQITTAKNGIVYKAEMMCVETPAGGNNEPDIDLVTSDQPNLAQGFVYDGGGASKLVISAGADYVAGMRKESAAGEDLSGLVDDYVYLAVGNGAGADGGYNAGKFVIKLYGASF